MNRNAWSWRVVALSLLGLAVVPMAALAQGQGRGGGGGRGGFGGGMMGGGMMGGVTGLVMMEEVRKELKLSEEQETKIRDMGAEMMQQAFGGFGGRGGAGGGGGNRPDFQNMSEEERKKFRDEMQAKVAEQTKKAEESLKKVLTPEQNVRLNELRLQREGVQALGRAEVAGALKLTDAQNEAIAEILEAARPQRGGPGGGGPGGGFGRNLSDEERTKMREEMEARRKKTQEDIELVMTEDQKAAWTKMQGAKFEFPERPSFGGGFGRGGAGGGPGGAGGAPGGGPGGGRRNRGGQGGEDAPRGGDRPARPPVDS
jgi:Spy/CpxP family protein refolding chaperone